jgi:hypothetical protein
MKKDAMQRLAEWRTGLRYWRSTDRSMKAYHRFAVERTDALSRACKYFELDPDNPKDAGVLLRVLAEVVFGSYNSQNIKKYSNKPRNQIRDRALGPQRGHKNTSAALFCGRGK